MKAKRRDEKEGDESESKVSLEKLSFLKKSALAAILVIFALALTSGVASAGVIKVPEDYTTIQGAINAVDAANRTIEVNASAYNAQGIPETVVVNKSDIIIKSVNGRAVVSAGGTDDHVFNITDQRNVTLQGFEIRDAHGTSQTVAGIYMNNASECNISDNFVTNISATDWRSFGIWMKDSDNNTFSSSTSVSFINAGNDAVGIELDSSTNNTFSSSTSVSFINATWAFGIALGGSTNNTFSSSTSVSFINAANQNAYGILLEDSANNKFSSSTSVSFINAANGDAFGIYLVISTNNKFSSGTTVSNLTANDDAYGIYLSWSDDNEFYDCTISDLTAGGAPTTYGVYMDESDNNTISQAKIFKGAGPPIDCGVYMQGCSDDFILDSDIFDCYYGIYIDDKSTHTISGNKIYGNDFVGIYLTRTWDNIITENEIRDNGEGILIEESSFNNTIERNMIKRNGVDTGVYLTTGSYENEIHENCFIDNVPQAYDDVIGGNNDWDRNYWSPPPGEPGDPYLIPGDAGSRDNDPLPYCPGRKPPAKVPALTPTGIIALIGLLSVVLAVSIRIGRKR